MSIDVVPDAPWFVREAMRRCEQGGDPVPVLRLALMPHGFTPTWADKWKGKGARDGAIEDEG